MGTLRSKKVYVEALPIPKAPFGTRRQLDRLVDRITAAKDADVAAEERAVDRLVYDLYGLVKRGIAAVRGALSP